MNKTQLYLSGGGSEKDSMKLDTLFLQALSGKKLLYVPIAMDPDSRSYESCLKWLTKLVSDISGTDVKIDLILDLSLLSEEKLAEYDGVYIGGGNTYKLLDLIMESKFDSKLRDYINKGYPVYGGSAGAIIMGRTIEIVNEENDANYSYTEGLACLGTYSVICHYTPSLDTKIQDFIACNHMPVLALPERSGLYINGSEANVVGYDSMYIFSSSSIKRIEVNNTFTLI